MTASDGHPDDLLELFAMNALQPDQRDAVARHLADCRRCRRIVSRTQEVSAALAEDVATDPPAGLRNSVLAAIAETPQEPSAPADDTAQVDDTPQIEDAQVEDAAQVDDIRQSAPRASVVALTRRPGAIVLAAAAVVLVAVSGVVFALRPETASPSAELARAADARSLALDATSEEAAPGRIEVVWSAEADRLGVKAADLADPGPGRTYALWFLLADGVAPAGLFDPESGSFDGVLDVDDLDPIGWGVTIEPDGGSPQPTGEVLYAAAF